MNRLLMSVSLLAAGLVAVPVLAAENEVEALRRQLGELQAQFERSMRSQREQIEALQRQLDALQRPAVPAVAEAVPGSAAASVSPVVEPQRAWRPTDPIRIGSGTAYADVGVVATFAVGGSTAEDIEGGTQLGGHDPNQRGFTVQSVELNLQGAVDPYFRGNVNLLFQLDSGGESLTELEEAWLETVALPANLQLRAGQFLSDFGRINTQHPHEWGFVDVPLVAGRFLGPDGLRNPGARLSWLAPTPFYSELFFGVQNSQGETAAGFRGGEHHHGGEAEELPFGFRHADNDRGVRSVGDLLFTPRWATSFELTDNQSLLAGISGAFGPNASGEGGDTRTEIYGVDLTWKWKSPNHQRGFPFVAWQTEAMLRRYELGEFDWDEVAAGEPRVLDAGGVTPAVVEAERVKDWGLYSQLLWGFKPGWVAGLRADYVTSERAAYEQAGLFWDDGSGTLTPLGRDPLRDRRWRLSPNLTWYPSEFSKIRLQYNFDDRRELAEDHSVWLQFEFLLGAHAAHKF